MSKSLILHILLKTEWLTSWQSYLEYQGGLSCWNRATDRPFGPLTGSLAEPFPTCHAKWTQYCSLTWLFYWGLTVWWHSVSFPKNTCSNYTSHLFKALLSCVSPHPAIWEPKCYVLHLDSAKRTSKLSIKMVGSGRFMVNSAAFAPVLRQPL